MIFASYQNNCFETKGFLSPICNQQMTNFGKGKNIWGRKKKLIHFKVPRGNLFWTLVILLIKHEKLLNNGTIAHFPFRVGCTQFFYRFIFFVTLNHQNCLMSAFENAWKSFERICAKRFLPFDEFFCWKLFDEKFFKTIQKHTSCYALRQQTCHTFGFGSSRKSVQGKDLFELKKGNAPNWEDLFSESKIRYRTRDRPGGLRFSIISFTLY